jgi:hypothetical protein
VKGSSLDRKHIHSCRLEIDVRIVRIYTNIRNKTALWEKKLYPNRWRKF